MKPALTADCGRAAGLLTAAWEHEPRKPECDADAAWLRQHLRTCADCRGLAETWQQLGALAAPAPDPAREAVARQRFEAMLAAARRPPAPWRRHPLIGAGPHAAAPRAPRLWLVRSWAPVLAVAVLAAAVGAGWWLRGAARPPASETEVAALHQEVQTMRGEVDQTRQLAVLSLLRQQSANDRLQGVSDSARLPQIDSPIEQALLHTLKFDPSPDVRLAALDVLARQAEQPALQAKLLHAFVYQQSPLVQVALMDRFLASRDAQARPLLRRVSRDNAYLPEVRRHAAWGLAQPGWN